MTAFQFSDGKTVVSLLPDFVSVHGGHSGEFCTHAKDKLEEVIKEYIKKKFVWVGITEHVPPHDNKYIYPHEAKLGLTAQLMREKFSRYIDKCKHLKEKYKDQIDILVAFETEAYEGAFEFAQSLVLKYDPDYIVGSVHHVNNMDIDTSEETYKAALQVSGGYDQLYLDYFDRQYEMLQTLKPPVVGHFDLVRIFDSNYKLRLNKKSIWLKIVRNLTLIKKLDLILDFNLRAFTKGADEPYISDDILGEVRHLGIKIAPGDDSHGVKTVGLNLERGINILAAKGFSLNWPRPIYLK